MEAIAFGSCRNKVIETSEQTQLFARIVATSSRKLYLGNPTSMRWDSNGYNTSFLGLKGPDKGDVLSKK